MSHSLSSPQPAVPQIRLGNGSASPTLRRVGGSPSPNAPLLGQLTPASRILPETIGSWPQRAAGGPVDSKDHPLPARQVGLLGWVVLVVIGLLLLYANINRARSTNTVASMFESSGQNEATLVPNPLFLFPKPSQRVFVTSSPNRGAGLGHQFGEWVMGPYMAYIANVSYIETGFQIQSAPWNHFLGFGEGEATMEDLTYNYPADRIRIIRQDWESHIKDPSHEVDWMLRTVSANEPTLLSDEVLLVYYDVVHTHDHSVACHPPLNLKLRQKYCAARIAHPLHQDLYAADRAAGRIVIAVHYRCGDSCLEYTYRATPFESTVASIVHIANSLSSLPEVGGDRSRLAFHFFAQRPKNLPPDRRNLTAETHFQTLFDDEALRGLDIKSHFDTTPQNVMHHLVTSDIIFGSQSSFSWVANLLHHTVSVGPMKPCQWGVDYRRDTGYIDEEALRTNFLASRAQRPRFQTIADCHAMQEGPAPAAAAAGE